MLKETICFSTQIIRVNIDSVMMSLQRRALKNTLEIDMDKSTQVTRNFLRPLITWLVHPSS